MTMLSARSLTASASAERSARAAETAISKAWIPVTGLEMAKFLDLAVNGIALGAVSGGTNTTQALLSTGGSNALQLSGANSSTLCRLSGVDQPQSDTDATNRLYLQSYVLGQIHGLKMKLSVQLCSTIPARISAANYSWAAVKPSITPTNLVSLLNADTPSTLTTWTGSGIGSPWPVATDWV